MESYLFGQQRYIVHSRQNRKLGFFLYEFKLKTQANKMESDVIYGNSEVKISVTIPINSFVLNWLRIHRNSCFTPIVAIVVSLSFFTVHSGSLFFHAGFSLNISPAFSAAFIRSACCFNTIFIFTAGLSTSHHL